MLQRDCSERAPRGAEEPGRENRSRRTTATPLVCPEHTLWGAGRIGYFLFYFFFFFFPFLSSFFLFCFSWAICTDRMQHTQDLSGAASRRRATGRPPPPALPHRLPRSPSAVPAVTRPALRPHVSAGSDPDGHRSSARASSGRGS